MFGNDFGASISRHIGPPGPVERISCPKLEHLRMRQLRPVGQKTLTDFKRFYGGSMQGCIRRNTSLSHAVPYQPAVVVPAMDSPPPPLHVESLPPDAASGTYWEWCGPSKMSFDMYTWIYQVPPSLDYVSIISRGVGIYIHIYIYTHTRKFVNENAYIHAYTYLCKEKQICNCSYTHIYIYTHIYPYLPIYIHKHVKNKHIHIYIFTYIYIFIFIHASACMHINKHVSTYTRYVFT